MANKLLCVLFLAANTGVSWAFDAKIDNLSGGALVLTNGWAFPTGRSYVALDEEWSFSFGTNAVTLPAGPARFDVVFTPTEVRVTEHLAYMDAFNMGLSLALAQGVGTWLVLRIARRLAPGAAATSEL